MADNEADEDDWYHFYHAQAAIPIGSVGSMERWPRPRRIKKRPIGFTADLDAEYEEK